MVGTDEGVNHGEAEAGAVGFGGDEGVEDFGEKFFRDPFPAVGDGKLEITILRLGSKRQVAAVGHGVGGVLNQVDENLAELVGIGLEGGAIVATLDLPLDPMFVEFTGEKINGGI